MRWPPETRGGAGFSSRADLLEFALAEPIDLNTSLLASKNAGKTHVRKLNTQNAKVDFPDVLNSTIRC